MGGELTAWRAGSGADLPVRVVGRRPGTPPRLLVAVAPEAWTRVLAESLFHLDPGSRGPLPPDLDASRDVELLLRLKDGLADEGAGDAGGVPDAWRDTENWYAEEVRQVLEDEMPGQAPGSQVVTGSRTGWAPATAAGPGSTPLLDVVQRYFTSHGVPTERIEDETILRLEGTGEHGEWTLWVHTREDEGVCVVWSAWPEEVPEGRRPAVMELLTRRNPDLAVGAFEMDLDRGAVSFRTSIDVTGDRLSEALVARLVGANVEAFDDLLPALQAVIGGQDPTSLVIFDA